MIFINGYLLNYSDKWHLMFLKKQIRFYKSNNSKNQKQFQPESCFSEKGIYQTFIRSK